jgi:hypothetical protein
MMADHRLPQDQPAFPGAIKASAVIGALVAAGLVATCLTGLGRALTHQAATPDTEATQSIAPARNVERGGAMTGYEILW